jgi:hypothetical protein
MYSISWYRLTELIRPRWLGHRSPMSGGDFYEDLPEQIPDALLDQVLKELGFGRAGAADVKMLVALDAGQTKAFSPQRSSRESDCCRGLCALTPP